MFLCFCPCKYTRSPAGKKDSPACQFRRGTYNGSTGNRTGSRDREEKRMAFDRAKAYLETKGLADRIVVPDRSSATVAEAAEALGCEPAMIAKTLSFLQDGEPVLILADGLARIDNRKYRERFGCKAKMIPAGQVEELVGHGIGGVCPFGVNDGVRVYLDESLKRHETVYPAAGSDHSGVRLTVAELEECSGSLGWVDVCRQPEE